MFSSLMMIVVLAQVPARAPGLGETAGATQSQPSERRKAELKVVVERRKERRAKAAAAWQRERDETQTYRRTAGPGHHRPAPDGGGRLHFQAQLARERPILYPFGMYPWPRPSGPFLLGPYQQPIPLGPFTGSSPIPLGPAGQ